MESSTCHRLKLSCSQFVDWVSSYTLAFARHRASAWPCAWANISDQDVIKSASPGGPAAATNVPARARVLRLVADGLTRSKGRRRRKPAVSASVINGLIDEGALETVVIRPIR